MMAKSLLNDFICVPVILLSWLTMLSGCAINQLKPYSSTCLPSQLHIIELTPSVQDAALERVLHHEEKDVTTETLQADRQRINERLQRTVEQILLTIHRTPEFIQDLPTSDTSLTTMDDALSMEILGAMQIGYPSDVYLRLRVTDFGETPRRWKTTYITFEVVSTLAIAGALYVHKTTKAVAGAYLLEESIEELSEGYAGFWALNRLSRPVRVEADVIDGHDGAILLHTKHTGMASWEWKNVWHMSDMKIELLTEQSLERAVSSALNDVNNFYLKHCGE